NNCAFAQANRKCEFKAENRTLDDGGKDAWMEAGRLWIDKGNVKAGV
nr:hypothetical protein [Tanacetum cinerariifolium]